MRNAAASLTLAVFMFPIAEDLGWSRTLIAGAASVGGLAASVASPVVGWLVDRYGARLVLGVSVLVLGLSTISLAWATVPIAFYVAYGTGRVIFSSPVQIGASVVVSRWFIRRRGRAQGLLFVAHSAGMTIFPLIAALTIQAYGWRQSWIILGVLVWAVALGPVWLLIVESPEDVGLKPDGVDDALDETPAGPTAQREEPAWTLREAMRCPALWLLAVAAGSLFLVQHPPGGILSRPGVERGCCGRGYQPERDLRRRGRHRLGLGERASSGAIRICGRCSRHGRFVGTLSQRG